MDINREKETKGIDVYALNKKRQWYMFVKGE